VDDESDVCFVLERVLGENGFVVDVYEDPFSHFKQTQFVESFVHPWLGVDVTDLSNFVVVNHHYGAVVQDVDPDDPAAKIGIEGLEPNLSSINDPFIVHDIITAINGPPMKNSGDFYNYIHNKSVGDKVVLTTMHDGVTRNFTATLGEMPSPF